MGQALAVVVILGLLAGVAAAASVIGAVLGVFLLFVGLVAFFGYLVYDWWTSRK